LEIVTTANEILPTLLEAYFEQHELGSSSAFYLDRITSANDEWRRLEEYWSIWIWPDRLVLLRALLKHIEQGNEFVAPCYSKGDWGDDPPERAEGSTLWRRLFFVERIVSHCGLIPNMSLKQARQHVTGLDPEDALRFANGMSELQGEVKSGSRDCRWLFGPQYPSEPIVWVGFEREAWIGVTSSIGERLAELVVEQLKERRTVLAPNPIPTLWSMSTWLEIWGTLQFARAIPYSADSSLLVEHFDFGSKAKDLKGQLNTYRQRGKDKPVSKADRKVLTALIAAIERRLAEE
jgi:hypothetical protein